MKKVATKKKTTKTLKPKKSTKIKGLEEYKDDELDLDEDYEELDLEDEEEVETELSVESLLEATAEAQEALEDIGYNEKSEVRIMIEKFVDENPDAVAQLLRNWLNEDWE